MHIFCNLRRWGLGLTLVLAGSAAAAAPATPAKLHLEYTTTALTGKFSPKHVLAVWVTDGQTNFVRTLELRAQRRQRYLSAWQSARRDEAVVDGVTGATLGQPQAHQLNWDCKNLKGDLVPDGSYLVFLELTSQNGPGPVIVIPFVKGATPQTVKVAKQTGCESAVLTYTPPAP